MTHRFTRFATRVVGVALPIGLSACLDPMDPASPERDSAPAKGAAVQGATASLAVQDALTRLIPNLSHPALAAALAHPLREFAAALADSNDAVTAVALERARAAVDQYASSSAEDEADVDAIRLAIAAHAATNPR